MRDTLRKLIGRAVKALGGEVVWGYEGETIILEPHEGDGPIPEQWMEISRIAAQGALNAMKSMALPTPKSRVAALYIVSRAGTMLISSAAAQLLKPSVASKRKVVDRVAALLEMDVQHAMEQEAAKKGERMAEDGEEQSPAAPRWRVV